MKTQLYSPWLALLVLLSGGSGCREVERGRELVDGAGVRYLPDVVYARKFGTALTMEVFRPARANGAGILFPQSRGWNSQWQPPGKLREDSWFIDPLLNAGYTVFAIWHGNAPKYVVPDIVEDVRMSSRFVRAKAADFGISPNRIGALGASSGGHLAMMLGVTPDMGRPDAIEPEQRSANRIKAVVAISAPSDLRGWVGPTSTIAKTIPGVGPPLSFDSERAADLSPVLRVTPNSAPTLLVHGADDETVPPDHSRSMYAALQREAVKSELVLIDGAKHGYEGAQRATVIAAAVKWFDTCLADDE